jgi:tetratricopeptide (TPR) repeat protein
MTLPKDRPSLLRLAEETERVLAETANAGDEKTARRHTKDLFQLGVIRQRLGESQEAVQLYDESANASWNLNWSVGREFSAMARIGQAGALVTDGRSDEGLRIIERLIEQFGGFPEFKTFTWMRSNGLELWLSLLEEAEEWERLYDAAGIALALLDPADPTTDQAALTKAVLARATAAHELGYNEEAVETYENAIARLEAEEPERPSKDLLEAMSSVAALLTELGREEEAAAAYARVIVRFKLVERIKTSTEPWVEEAASEAWAWLEKDGGLSGQRASEPHESSSPTTDT